MLISKAFGSYTIIGSIVLSTKIEGLTQKDLETDHCGNCTKCIDACPPKAIIDNTEVPTPLEDALNNMLVIEAVFKSPESGKWIKL